MKKIKSKIIKNNYFIFLERILVHVPSRRPSIDQMLSSQWIKDTHNLASTSDITKVINSRKKFNFWSTSTTTTTTSSSVHDRHSHSKCFRKNSDQQTINDIENLTIIKCNTKRDGSIMDEKFLYPIDNEQLQEAIQPPPIITKRSIFSGNLKKKIGPMETEKGKKKILKNNNLNDIKSMDLMTATSDEIKKDLLLLNEKNYYDEEEQGEFIMLPTITHDLTHLHPLEVEARHILIKLGVTNDMLCKSITNGPRSELIGAYRIIIHRLQKQIILSKQNDNAINISKDEMKARPKSNRMCSIL